MRVGWQFVVLAVFALIGGALGGTVIQAWASAGGISASGGGAAIDVQAVAATGATQGAATALTYAASSTPGIHVVRITAGDGGGASGVRLPSGTPNGDLWVVFNEQGACPSCGTRVYPPTGGSLVGGGSFAPLGAGLGAMAPAWFLSNGSNSFEGGQWLAFNNADLQNTGSIELWNTVSVRSALTVNGGNVGLTFSGGSYIAYSANTAVTAHAGGGQGSATLICSGGRFEQNILTTVATSGDSVAFDTGPAIGQHCLIKNKGAASANLFPQSGGTLCVAGAGCLASNASTAIAVNAQLDCYAESTTVWNCK